MDDNFFSIHQCMDTWRGAPLYEVRVRDQAIGIFNNLDAAKSYLEERLRDSAQTTPYLHATRPKPPSDRRAAILATREKHNGSNLLRRH